MAAVRALTEEGYDFAYIHVEAPDEMGHQGSVERKVKAIEYLDARVIRIVKKELEQRGEDFRMLILPDHPTPIAMRTHTSDPIPYMLYDSTVTYKGSNQYTEAAAKEAGIYIEEGYKLMDHFLQAE